MLHQYVSFASRDAGVDLPTPFAADMAELSRLGETIGGCDQCDSGDQW